MREEHVKWYSHQLSGDIDMLIYGHAGYPVVIFPTSMGKYYEAKDRGLIESVRWYVEQGLVRLYCPDSIDSHSWYNRNIHPADKVRNHIWYDKMVCHEIVEKVRFHTPVGKVAVAGCSFGGYHAANFAFRHPGYVSHMFSMSGAFSITNFMDGYYDDNVYFNNPVDYLPGMNDPELWKMDIVLGTSDWDICLDQNLHMSQLLHNKGLSHWLDMRKWAKHDWPIWCQMFPHYLSRINFG